MTIVMSVNTLSEIILVADTRLSGTDTRGIVHVRQDVCQKLFLGNHWSVIGFSGQLCIARHLLRGFLARLQRSDSTNSDWLRHDEVLLHILKQGVQSHPTMRVGQGLIDHRNCQKEPVELLIAWVDHQRDMLGEPRNEADTSRPPRMETIVLRTPDMVVERHLHSVSTIGSGSVITEAMRKEAYLKIAWHAKGIPYERMHRTFLTAIIARDLLNDDPVASVGDALQLMYLDRNGVYIVPYFYWIPVGDRHGTYLAMRIEHGEWIQEHRPTGAKLPITSPFEFQLRYPTWRAHNDRIIDPKLLFTPNSPGVVEDHNGRLVYVLYDPNEVHDEVRGSWGPVPLAPITWSDSMKSPPKRFRP